MSTKSASGVAGGHTEADRAEFARLRLLRPDEDTTHVTVVLTPEAAAMP